MTEEFVFAMLFTVSYSSLVRYNINKDQTIDNRSQNEINHKRYHNLPMKYDPKDYLTIIRSINLLHISTALIIVLFRHDLTVDK